MRWAFWRKREWRTLGQRYAAEHSAWLTMAMKRGPAAVPRIPRIPVKPVDQGGYEAMMRRENGAERAQQWWGTAFDKTP